jgi:hypothetical protein
MVKNLVSFFLVTCSVAVLGAALPRALHAEPDTEGSVDHPVYVRVPGYHIIEFENNNDSVDFDCARDKKSIVDGPRMYFNYEIDEGGTAVEEQEILDFYAKIARKQGGAPIFMGETTAGYKTATFKINKKDRETWVIVTPFDEGAGYFLYVVDHPLNPSEKIKCGTTPIE